MNEIEANVREVSIRREKPITLNVHKRRGWKPRGPDGIVRLLSDTPLLIQAPTERSSNMKNNYIVRFTKKETWFGMKLKLCRIFVNLNP